MVMDRTSRGDVYDMAHAIHATASSSDIFNTIMATIAVSDVDFITAVYDVLKTMDDFSSHKASMLAFRQVILPFVSFYSGTQNIEVGIYAPSSGTQNAEVDIYVPY
jgi:hypothetical protein